LWLRRGELVLVLVLRFNGCAMGMLFAFGFSDHVGAQNLEPSSPGVFAGIGQYLNLQNPNR